MLRDQRATRLRVGLVPAGQVVVDQVVHDDSLSVWLIPPTMVIGAECGLSDYLVAGKAGTCVQQVHGLRGWSSCRIPSTTPCCNSSTTSGAACRRRPTVPRAGRPVTGRSPRSGGGRCVAPALFGSGCQAHGERLHCRCRAASPTAGSTPSPLTQGRCMVTSSRRMTVHWTVDTAWRSRPRR
mgnify:CR=1 FL=1